MTNCAQINPEELAIFHVNPCRTDREMGNSSKIAQNSKNLIPAFGSAIGCNLSGSQKRIEGVNLIHKF